MKKLIVNLIMLFPFFLFGQKNCNCKLDDISKWNEKEHGINSSLSSNGKLFQHPVTTFYRWGENSWYHKDDEQSSNLSRLRTMLLSSFLADYEIGNVAEKTYHKFRAVYEDIYD